MRYLPTNLFRQRVLWLAAVVLVFSALAHGQQISSSISGVVTDDALESRDTERIEISRAQT